MKRKIISATEQSFVFALGIVAQIPEYRICHRLNKVAGFSLERSGLLLHNKKSTAEPLTYECYVNRNEQDIPLYYLIRNHQENGYLLPKYRQADYILAATHAQENPDKEELQKRIIRISEVQTTFILPVTQLEALDVQ